jgi:hypothetical protein
VEILRKPVRSDWPEKEEGTMLLILIGILMLPATMFAMSYASHILPDEWYQSPIIFAILYLGIIACLFCISFGAFLLSDKDKSQSTEE